MIFVPVLLTGPSQADLEQVLEHARSAISRLNRIETLLQEMSSEPDAAMLAIRGQVDLMQTTAGSLKGHLAAMQSRSKSSQGGW